MKLSDVLSRLHPFYQPSPPTWKPQTIGWYVVFLIVAALFGWCMWNVSRVWRKNRYRRAALTELQQAEITDVPALLKRTALAAFPRAEVASLEGEAWLRFLRAHENENHSIEILGTLLLDLDYRGRSFAAPEEEALRKFCSQWIKEHRVRT